MYVCYKKYEKINKTSGILPPYLKIYSLLIIRVADPDPNWIRIQSGQWIRIRIRNPVRIQEGKTDPQK